MAGGGGVGRSGDAVSAAGGALREGRSRRLSSPPGSLTAPARGPGRAGRRRFGERGRLSPSVVVSRPATTTAASGVSRSAAGNVEGGASSLSRSFAYAGLGNGGGLRQPFLSVARLGWRCFSIHPSSSSSRPPPARSSSSSHTTGRVRRNGGGVREREEEQRACVGKRRDRQSGIQKRSWQGPLRPGPRPRGDDPHNLSILISGGKETNRDSPSKGD